VPIRRRALPRLLVLLCALAAAACSGDDGPPTRLADGSPAEATTVELEGVEAPTLATKVDLIRATRIPKGSADAACLASGGVDPGSFAVRRVSIAGESVTLRTASGGALRACDDSSDSQSGETWCGHAYGRLEAGRLTDPRLDLACTTDAGDPVAFAWVEPSADAAFVAARQRGFVEVYKTAGDLPVRVATTTGIVEDESSATLEISEHDLHGALLRTYALDARVAG
jgi:hypothetical protein